MNKITDIKNSAPLFRQFKEQIIDELKALGLKAGDKIPSETVLCHNNSVSIRTVRRALSELEKEGIIVRRQGVGSFLVDLKASESKQSKGTIGILFSDMAFVVLPMFSKLLFRIEKAIIQSGYSFHLYAMGDRLKNQNTMSMEELLPKHDLSGLIATSALNTEDIVLLRRRKIPLVTFNDYKNLQFNTVRADFYSAARVGIRHLLSQNLKKTAFICGHFSHDKSSPVIFNHDYFLQGIKDELSANTIKFDKQYVIEAALTKSAGIDAGKALLASEMCVDSIFTTSQLLAEGISAAIEQNKSQCKHHPVILTFCTDDFSLDTQKMLLPLDEMADAAIALLIKKMDGDAAGRTKKVFEVALSAK
jgi:DNA-binding LacI/PurR family transcriptional regulator